MNGTTSTLTAIGIMVLAGIAVSAILSGDMTLANMFLKVFGGM